MAAFIGEGLVVGDANVEAGILVSAPLITTNSFLSLKVAFVYRANILQSGDSTSIVVLSGSYSSKDVDRLAGEISGMWQPMLSDPEPLSSKMTKNNGKGWWSPIMRMGIVLERGSR